MNQLEKKSVSVDQFYGNSIQSARGQLAILFSILPNINQKVATKYPKTQLKSIAALLNDINYQSIFFQASPLNNFDNGLQFVKNNHFDTYSVTPYIKKEDAPYHWRSWGPESMVFFKRFMDFYDQSLDNKKPIFATLTTIASHYPFSSVPKHRRLVYENPKNIHQEYANAIHLEDLGLATFFKELKKRQLLDKSLIIITSDHAMPMGEHGIYHQEVGYYQESFRIPLFIHWPKFLSAKKIPGPFSQIDIPPTILDLIDAPKTSHHMMGTSIFSSEDTIQSLIQPYGKHFGFVQWPYKFIFHTKTGRYSAYDLETDPQESKNIISHFSKKSMIPIHKELERIYQLNHLYKTNAIYPNTLK